MFRKILIALAATASLSLAALTPTTASAAWGGWGGWHGHHHHGFWGPRYGVGFYGPGPGYYGGCTVQRRVIFTPWGPRVRWARICY